MEKDTRLVVIDGSNIFLRSYYGLIGAGFDQPTWGIHGTIQSIASFVRRFKPTHIIVVFDHGRSTYRLELYPDYKANRPKATGFDEADSADEQLFVTKVLLKLLGIRTWEEVNIEGDDVIAAVVERLRDQVDSTLVISGDKDLRQLVGQGVRVFHPSLKAKDRDPWTVDDIQAEYGVPPEKLVDIWALCGDKGDNIPGIPNIGEKRALALIQKHGDIYKVGLSDEARIEGYRRQIWINLKLVTLAPWLSAFNLSLTEAAFVPTTPDTEAGRRLLATLQEYDLARIITAWSGRTLWADRGKRVSDFKN